MRKIILLVTLLMATAYVATAQETLEEFKLKVGSFSKLKVSNSINVQYRCDRDSAGLAVFKAPASQAKCFLISNNGKGQLKVETALMEPPVAKLPTLTVYSEFLTEAENAGDSTVVIKSVAACPEFKVRQIGNGRIVVDNITATNVNAFLNTGNGTIVVSGSCQKATLKMVGTGLIQADELNAQDVTCKILGSGSIGCWPMYNLNVSGIGSTKIYYRGVPTVKKRGGGKLYQIQHSGNIVETE